MQMKTETAVLARDAAKARSARLVGIALTCAAVSTFSCLDATAKYLGREVDLMQIVWARYTFAMLLAFLFANPVSRPGMLRTGRPMLQIVRAAILLGSTMLNFLALRYLRLDQVLAIAFATPFAVAALSGPVLGEWVGPRRWAAIGVGFIGVLVVTRPGFGIVHPASLFAFLAMLCYAAYFLTTRVLSRTDSNETTLFYTNFVGAVSMLPVVPFFWTPLTAWQWTLLVLAGGFASLGHYMLIVAHRHAPASLLSSFVYSQLLGVTILGYVIFGDVPDAYTLTGAAIVISSGLYMLRREKIRSGDHRKE
jgi:drug/metabolite transporter (DMT)-like permease